MSLFEYGTPCVCVAVTHSSVGSVCVFENVISISR